MIINILTFSWMKFFHRLLKTQLILLLVSQTHSSRLWDQWTLTQSKPIVMFSKSFLSTGRHPLSLLLFFMIIIIELSLATGPVQTFQHQEERVKLRQREIMGGVKGPTSGCPSPLQPHWAPDNKRLKSQRVKGDRERETEGERIPPSLWTGTSLTPQGGEIMVKKDRPTCLTLINHVYIYVCVCISARTHVHWSVCKSAFGLNGGW